MRRISRLPSEAASRNMSACRAQAMSHVGCRLIVASSAKISRALPPGVGGAVARALATKSAISWEVEDWEAEDLASGRDPALSDTDSADVVSPGREMVGSPDIGALRDRPASCSAQTPRDPYTS